MTRANTAVQNKQESTQDFPFLNHENTASINLSAFPNSCENLKGVQVIKKMLRILSDALKVSI